MVREPHRPPDTRPRQAHTWILQHSRPESRKLVIPGIITAELCLVSKATAQVYQICKYPSENSLSSKNNLNLKSQQVALGWLHYKFPIWGRKFILPETTVTHCKEIHNQSVSTDREHPPTERAWGQGRSPDWRLGDSSSPGSVINYLCDLSLWGWLAGLVFSYMNTFITHDLEPMYTWNFVWAIKWAIKTVWLWALSRRPTSRRQARTGICIRCWEI